MQCKLMLYMLQNFYCYAKTVAEKTAMEEASRRGIHLLVVVPSLTLGEMLQPKLNLGIELLIVSYMKGKKAYPNTVSGYVDVQDVARAHVLVYEPPLRMDATSALAQWYTGRSLFK